MYKLTRIKLPVGGLKTNKMGAYNIPNPQFEKLLPLPSQNTRKIWYILILNRT
jgi:hypothetical protein